MSETKYTAPHMLLHWAVAALVVVQFVFAEAMAETFEHRIVNIEIGAGWTPGAIFHALTGALIGVLMIWRLGLRLTTVTPPPPNGPVWLVMLGRGAHALFYVLLIAMPIAGAAAWFAGSEPVAYLHDAAGKLLLALIALHIAAAAYHHFVLGDTSVIRRVWPR